MSDRWDMMLDAWRGKTDPAILEANASVGDAVFMAWLWWDAKLPEMKPTPADLIAMAGLIQDHMRWLSDICLRRSTVSSRSRND